MGDQSQRQQESNQIEASRRQETTLEALREAELRYRTVADFTYDWEIWEASDGAFRYVSPSCERITGYSAREFMANPHLLDELILPEDRDVYNEHRHAADSHRLGEVQFRIRSADGQIRWVEHICQPVADEQGNFLGYRASNRDITKRKRVQEELQRYCEHLEALVAERTVELAETSERLRREITDRERAEEALRRGEERYALAQRAANIGSWDWDIDTGDLFWSDQIEPMFGFERGEFGATYEAFLECVHPEDRQRVMDRVNASVETAADYSIEHRIVWLDGTIRWVQETGDVFRDGDGRPIRMLGIVQDITDRRQAQEDLRESEEKFRTAAEQSPSMIFVNVLGRVVYANPRCEEVLGYTKDELYAPGFEFQSLIAPEYRDLIGDSWTAHMRGQDLPPDEYVLITKEGQSIEVILAPKMIRYRGAHAVLVTVTDITERKRSEKALQELADDLTERVKDLNCLFGISSLAGRQDIGLDEILQGTVELLPPAWSYPEFTSARIVLDDWEYKTQNFRQTPWRQTSDLVVHGRQAGFVEICLLEEGSQRDEGPFLQAERLLLDAVAERLGRIAERKKAERALRQAKEAAEAARHEESLRRQEAVRRRRIAESLGDILRVLNSNRALSEVLDFITVQAGELLGTRAAGIYSLEKETGTWSIQATRGLLVTYIAGVRIPVGQDALYRAMTSLQPVAIPDLVASLATGEGHAAAAEHQVDAASWTRIYRALLAVPIVVQNEVYGGMLLYYGEPRVFNDEEIELAAAFGDQVALAIGNDRLREQVKEAATTAERDRLARELHDAVTQTLFSAGLIAEALPRVWERDPEQGLRGLQELRHLTRGAAAEMRTLLVELRPAALTEKPLGELLRHLTEAMTSRTRVPIDLKVDGNCTLPPDVQIALYRIVQEALNNVAKHAGASRIKVQLQCQPLWAALQINDDGAGFDPDDVLPDQFGLCIMRERAEGVGAWLDIDSQPGQGSKVSVSWPAARRG